MVILLPCVFTEFNVVDKEHGDLKKVTSGKMARDIYFCSC